MDIQTGTRVASAVDMREHGTVAMINHATQRASVRWDSRRDSLKDESLAWLEPIGTAYTADDMEWLRVCIVAAGGNPADVDMPAVMDEAFEEVTDMADFETGYAVRDDVDLDAVIAKHTRKGETALTVGDMSRDGLVQITDTRWDGNGTMFVTVREMIGGFDQWVGGKPAALRRMRALARRTLVEYHEGQTKSAATVRTWSDGGQSHATFAVTRLSE